MSSDNLKSITFKSKDKYMLVTSSLLFLIPGYFALLCNLQLHGIFSIVMSIVSIIYWISPEQNWRKTLDLIISNLYAIYFISTGIYCSNSLFQWQVLLAFPLSYLMIMNYIMSNLSWDYNLDQWVYFHVSFHFWSCILHLNTIYLIHKNQCY